VLAHRLVTSIAIGGADPSARVLDDLLASVPVPKEN